MNIDNYSEILKQAFDDSEEDLEILQNRFPN